jgi:predicted RNase H-like nuclease (RuvC/YqgF family)
MAEMYRRCGRKVKRTEMTPKQLQASIKWCKAEISKLQKELDKKQLK